MSALGLTFIDPVVVLVIIVSAIYATYRGFVSESLSIFAWAAAAFATLLFGPRLGPMTHQLVSTPWLATVIGYAVVFLVVLIPLSFISFRFSETVKHSPVNTLDRSLGFAFGVVRGLAVIGLAYIAFSLAVPLRSQPDWMTGARLLPLIQTSAEVLLSIVPNQHVGAVSAEAPSTHPDTAAVQTPRPPAAPAPKKKTHKTNGAEDRSGLDRLFEATGNGGTGKP
jgi:membrane protein required for colicin V production